jgi:hypothetical protein
MNFTSFLCILIIVNVYCLFFQIGDGDGGDAWYFLKFFGFSCELILTETHHLPLHRKPIITSATLNSRLNSRSLKALNKSVNVVVTLSMFFDFLLISHDTAKNKLNN